MTGKLIHLGPQPERAARGGQALSRLSLSRSTQAHLVRERAKVPLPLPERCRSASAAESPSVGYFGAGSMRASRAGISSAGNGLLKM